MTEEDCKQHRSMLMSRVRGTNTGIELLLRNKLFANGLRYRINVKKLPGTPDIVLPKYHTVVFVHGCFWHGHVGCKHHSIPKTNTDFWTAKIARNQERDQETWRQLEAKGWFVLVVWECELKKKRLEDTINSVVAHIRQNGKQYEDLKTARKKNRALYLEERRRQKEREQAFKEELNLKYPR